MYELICAREVCKAAEYDYIPVQFVAGGLEMLATEIDTLKGMFLLQGQVKHA